MTLNVNTPQCTATSKSTGERCKNPAAFGTNVCRMHGAKGAILGGKHKRTEKQKAVKPLPPPQGNQNARTHGAFSPRLLPDEQPAYEHFLEEYLRDVHNPSVTDRRAVERLAVLEAKWYMAVMKNAPGDALETLQRLLHRELKVLQVTRESKESQHGSGNTPAEIMATLLLQVAERKAELEAAPTLPSVEAKFEVVDVDVEAAAIETPDSEDPKDVGDGQSADA